MLLVAENLAKSEDRIPRRDAVSRERAGQLEGALGFRRGFVVASVSEATRELATCFNRENARDEVLCGVAEQPYCALHELASNADGIGRSRIEGRVGEIDGEGGAVDLEKPDDLARVAAGPERDRAEAIANRILAEERVEARGINAFAHEICDDLDPRGGGASPGHSVP